MHEVRKLSDFIKNILICVPKINGGLTALQVYQNSDFWLQRKKAHILLSFRICAQIKTVGDLKMNSNLSLEILIKTMSSKLCCLFDRSILLQFVYFYFSYRLKRELTESSINPV